MTASTLPEVHEGDAPPEVAAIYAGLREAVGIPTVNLIWRHFATLPGVLPWAWEATRGVIASATVRDGAERMAAGVRRRAGLGLAAIAPALRALPVEDLAGLARVVDVYNRGNSVNLQVLSAVGRCIADGSAAAAPSTPEFGRLPPVAESIPPLPRMDALPEAVRAEVFAFARWHDPSGSAVPSLYRHLALWPSVLAPLRGALAPRFADGSIASLRGALLGVAEESAEALLPRLAPPGPFPPEHRDAVLRVLGLFPGKLIAEMAAVGLMLEAALHRGG